MTIQDIRAQEQRQLEIDYVEKIRRTIRSDYKIEDGVPMPPAWVWVALAVLVVGLAVWDGGIWW